MISMVATRGEKEVATGQSVEAVRRAMEDPEAHVWVDLSGAMDEDALRVVQEIFRFHPLAVEDCFGEREHPKIEGYDGYVYLITHGMGAGATAEESDTVELDVFLGQKFLVTYHAKPSRSVSAVVEIVRRGGDLLRRAPVLVLHAMLERQVENMEPAVEAIEERLAEIEERVFSRPSNSDLATMLALRRNILQLRRWMLKQRDVMLGLSRNEFNIVASQDAILFRDIYDHFVRFTDLLEHYREITTSIQEASLSIANARLNEHMRFLTLFTAVLMPLTVITGIYGMNFQYMPELRAWWGYPTVLAAMLVTSGAILFFFWRKGWLGVPKDLRGDSPLPPASTATETERRSGAR